MIQKGALVWSAWCLGMSRAIVSAFVSKASINTNRRFDSCTDTARWSKTSWSPADDWSSLSSDHPENAVPDSDAIFNEDIVANAAIAMQGAKDCESNFSEEDNWVHDAVDTIHHNGFYFEPSENDPKLYDTSSEEIRTLNFEDEMGREISMLVHCNESPEEMLIGEGRALAPLSDEERNDVTQLLTQKEDGTFAQTPFFHDAVSTMFREHSALTQVNGTDVAVLNAASVARWMSKSLGGDDRVGPHDKRVLSTISRFGQYGTGCLTEQDFHNLYLSVAVGGIDGPKRRLSKRPTASYSAARRKQLKDQEPTIESIWRDIRNHGLLSPVESERLRLAEKIREKYGAADRTEAQARGEVFDSLLDECEILDYIGSVSAPSTINADDSNNDETSRVGKSSHELVELCSDNQTPKRVRDGEFVFIDEQSCIGCTQCAQIAPSSFLMLEEGRARTFEQRNTEDVKMAVSACPVNCMHKMSFRELKEMELARDANDWEDVDRRHLNHRRGNVPLNVAGMDSDANHRSSWYHYLKQKCHMSKDCPQRGCYDCPHFASPGDNPYFKEKHRKAEHVRASDLSDSMWRKTAEL